MYRTPITEISQTIHLVAELPDLQQTEYFAEFSSETIEAILQEAARFSENRIAPLNRSSDQQGSIRHSTDVITPDGWKQLYQDWSKAGWNALTGDPAFGGQGLPMLLAVAIAEIWNSGSLSFTIASTLTMGAVEALEQHASEELKSVYLNKLISGEWTGTMNLTEPQAGSDLGALRTRAERSVDGSYRIFGQKIFITYGEHDLTDNIIHLVLARLPDAPEGSKGISLFLVPKFLMNEDGTIGRRNDVFCTGIETKLGLHASPTCTMNYGDGLNTDAAGNDGEKGAVGYLIGEENNGLACMFTMMNNARLLVGIQGVAIAEAAYQKALAYARERKQSRAFDAPATPDMSPIIRHPDVQRMLLTMKSLTQAARSICYVCAHALDMAKANKGNPSFWADRASLLTPLAKAFSTDIGVEVASAAIQVHGGIGYIEESGAPQLLRDARILPIYEGTNGIQAIDLVMRKLKLDNGQHIYGFLKELREITKQAANLAIINKAAPQILAAIDAAEKTTRFLQKASSTGDTNGQQIVLSGATPYLRLLALTAGGAYLAKAALGSNDEATAEIYNYFVANILPETQALQQVILNGSASLGAAAALILDH